MMLCKWHGTGIKPAVDNLRYTVHLFAALRAGDRHIIDEWAVKLNLSICLLIHLFCIFFHNVRVVRAHRF